MSVVANEESGFLLCLVLSIPLGFIYSALTSKLSSRQRYQCILLVGILFILISYNLYILLHILVQSCYVYFLTTYCSPNYNSFLSTGIAFMHCLYCHWSVYGISTGLDITRPMMLNTFRTISYALSASDAFHLKQSKDSNPRFIGTHPLPPGPTILEYFAFLFCFPNLLTGPFIFFDEFIAYAQKQEHKLPSISSVNEAMANGHTKASGEVRVPRRLFVNAAASVTLHAAIILLFNRYADLKQFYVPGYKHSSLVHLYGRISQYSFIVRRRFYFAWAMAELAMLAAGFGFSGWNQTTGEAEFSHARNVDWVGFELAANAKEKWSTWNTGTARILRDCVYLRVRRPWNVWLTFMVSAAWHGLFPGFYVAFLFGSWCTFVSRAARDRLGPWLKSRLPSWHVYRFLGFLSVALFTDYMSILIRLQKLDKIVHFIQMSLGLPIVGLFLLQLILLGKHPRA